MLNTRKALLALLPFLTAGLQGCAEVAPWERGNLAKPHMALEPYPMQSSVARA